MIRNLDLTALRSFVTVAEVGGVTRAAGVLNLTQSAVSMQLKRLEELMGIDLLDRSSRTIGLTSAGQQLLGYGQKMLALNDEVYARLTTEDFEGEIRFGVPHDIIYPRIPPVLRDFAKAFPRVKVRLISAPTRRLRVMFERGEVDLILTTEETPGEQGESLIELPLVWMGAVGGTSWRERPLPLAFCSNCIFRDGSIRAVERAGIDWHLSIDSELDNAVSAAVSADLGITVFIEGESAPMIAPIDHGGALPDLGTTRINLYVQRVDNPVETAFADFLRRAHARGRALPELVTA